MRTLFLMRHAKSSYREAKVPDHDRPLNARGLRAAPEVGRMLAEEFAEEGLKLDHVLTSSAVRALETAKAVVRELGFNGPLDITSRLYLAEPEVYLETIEDLAPEAKTILVVGHNPGISDLLRRLTGFKDEMTTAAVARLDLPIESFRELSRARGRYELADYLVPPREPGGESD